MHNEGILIKASKLNLQGQRGSKMIRVGFKGSLVEAIGASSSMQPLKFKACGFELIFNLEPCLILFF